MLISSVFVNGLKLPIVDDVFMLFEGVWDKINVYSNVGMFDKIFWVSVMEVKVLQEVSGSVLFFCIG